MARSSRPGPLSFHFSSGTCHFLGLDDILGAVWNAIVWIGEKAAIIAEAVWEAFKKAAHYAWAGLKWLGGMVKDAAVWLKDRIVDFAKWWKDVAAPWFNKIFLKIHDFFLAHFGWLIKWVGLLHTWLKWIYSNVLSPILTVLNITRAVLQLLADFGVTWAKKLENILSQFEQQLLGLYFQLVQFVNEISTVIGFMYDPKGTLFRDISLWTGWRFGTDLLYLFRALGIDRDPKLATEALMAGALPLDNKTQGTVLVQTLETPDEDLRKAAQDLIQALQVP